MTTKQRNGTAPIAWRCRVCKEPIADGEGYLQADVRLACERVREARQCVRDEGPFKVWDLAELMALPPLVPWEAYHRDCDPELEGPQYWFDVERIRTAVDVIDWTAHLMEKNWLEQTNWSELLRFVLPLVGREQPRAVRRSVPTKLRQVILERDYECQRCGATENLTIDHIIPVSRGGSNDAANLQVLCMSCNIWKGNR